MADFAYLACEKKIKTDEYHSRVVEYKRFKAG